MANSRAHDELVVLIHGSAAGAPIVWSPLRSQLQRAGRRVLAPDLLGYGAAPPASSAYTVQEEVEHLQQAMELDATSPVHLVAHSIGATFALHLRLLVGERVRRMTLVEPVVTSILREFKDDDAYADMKDMFYGLEQRLSKPMSAAEFFLDHWNGAGAWTRLDTRAQIGIASLIPKVRQETLASAKDDIPLAELSGAPVPTSILVGDRTANRAPRVCARRLAAAFHAEVRVVAAAGHSLPLSHAEDVFRAIIST